MINATDTIKPNAISFNEKYYVADSFHTHSLHYDCHPHHTGYSLQQLRSDTAGSHSELRRLSVQSRKGIVSDHSDSTRLTNPQRHYRAGNCENSLFIDHVRSNPSGIG